MKTRTEERIEQLYKLGMKLMEGPSFGYENKDKKIFINFHHTDISFDDDDKWNRSMREVTEIMKGEGVIV